MIFSGTYGFSMRPLIWGGQHCVAATPLTDEPQIGDLLVFIQLRNGEKKGIVHRLVEIRKDGDGQTIYITRGDNCFRTESIRREDIYGKVTEIHRISGYRPWHIIPLKKFTLSHPLYRLYSRIWSATWPARRVYYKFREKFSNTKSRLKSVINLVG